MRRRRRTRYRWPAAELILPWCQPSSSYSCSLPRSVEPAFELSPAHTPASGGANGGAHVRSRSRSQRRQRPRSRSCSLPWPATGNRTYDWHRACMTAPATGSCPMKRIESSHGGFVWFSMSWKQCWGMKCFLLSHPCFIRKLQICRYGTLLNVHETPIKLH
jgi:hypothetical protein